MFKREKKKPMTIDLFTGGQMGPVQPCIQMYFTHIHGPIMSLDKNDGHFILHPAISYTTQFPRTTNANNLLMSFKNLVKPSSYPPVGIIK